MKLLHTLTSISVFSLSSIASADCLTCETTQGEYQACKTAKCEKSNCDKSTCDLDSANTVSYIVTGMTCDKCSDKLQKALAATEGVTDKKVCHESGCVKVAFDPTKVDKAKVQAVINATGFKVSSEKLNIPVLGMTCTECTEKVTKALTSLEGCTVGKACYKSNHVEVTIDLAKTTQAKVEEAINATGFKVKNQAPKEESKAVKKS